MQKPYNYDRVELQLEKGKIKSIKNLKHLLHTEDFEPEFKKPKTPKIYLLKNDDFYLYVGATIQPINIKLSQGLRANGTNGYYGYKWKEIEKAELFVWNFEGMDKNQMESIEAEIVYEIRNKYGKWPLFQNEIHFNNEFSLAKKIGKDVFSRIEKEYPIKDNLDVKNITNKPLK